jgi:hypothetical protein
VSGCGEPSRIAFGQELEDRVERLQLDTCRDVQVPGVDAVEDIVDDRDRARVSVVHRVAEQLAV